MRLGDHCCRCDLCYLYHFDDLTMEVSRTCGDETMSDFGFRGSSANRFDARDHVPSTGCGGLAMEVKQIGHDAHGRSDCAVKRAVTVATVSVAVGEPLSLSMLGIPVPRDRTRCQTLVLA